MKDYENMREKTFQTRRITQIGNSYGITLSSEMLEYLRVAKGEDVQVEMRENQLMIKKVNESKLPEGISEDFFEVLHETVTIYDATLKELKDR